MEAIKADIPMPTTTKSSGQVKFLIRDNGQQLGYVLKAAIKPSPTSALPEKYRRETKGDNGLVFGPPEQVVYDGHFEFTLKDADGFVLVTVSSPVEHLSAGPKMRCRESR
jgi:hypothetical protein